MKPQRIFSTMQDPFVRTVNLTLLNTFWIQNFLRTYFFTIQKRFSTVVSFLTKSTAKRISRDRRANCAAHGFTYKYCMAQWFIQIQRKDNDGFDFPIGKVQYFRTELIYHGFSILEHPDYPGYARARFLALHARDSMITYIAVKYPRIDFEYK